MRITFRGVALLSCLAVITSGSGAFASHNDAAAATNYRPKTLTLTDQKGDANGLNGQSLYDLGSRPTPVQNDSADLLKIQYASTGRMVREGRRYVPQCTGFTVTVTLAAGPTTKEQFFLFGTTEQNNKQYELDNNHTQGTIFYRRDSLQRRDLITPVKVSGRTLTFTVTEADVAATDEYLPALKIFTRGASSITSAGAGEWDKASYKGTFEPC